jgi:hypothetical protein
MLQVATFALPTEQDQANEFLKTHVPEGPVNFNKDTIVVFYDDGVRSPAEEIAHLRELGRACSQSKIQLEVALEVLKMQRADLNPVKNAGPFEAVSAQIVEAQRQLDTLQVKATFVQSRIDELTK